MATQVLRRSQHALKNVGDEDADDGEKPNPKGRGKGRGRGRGKTPKGKAKAKAKTPAGSLTTSTEDKLKDGDTCKGAMPENLEEHVAEKLPGDVGLPMPEPPAAEPEKKRRRRTTSKPKKDAEEKAAAETSVGNEEPKPKAKARAQRSSKVPKVEGEGASAAPVDAEPAKKKRIRSEVAQTFARRDAPSNPISAAKWKALRAAFESTIKPRLKHYSAHEDRVFAARWIMLGWSK